MAEAAEAALDEGLHDPLASATRLAARVSGAPHDERVRSLTAGIYAVRGCDRALAGCADPALLIARDAPEARSHLALLGEEVRSHDYLCAGIALEWAGEAEGAVELLDAAHRRAIDEGRGAFALGILERLAHHASISGNAAMPLRNRARATFWLPCLGGPSNCDGKRERLFLAP